MISDGVVIGVVLGLVFAAVSYYLYSRVNQLERKVGLMENILLDLKVTTEQIILSATEPVQTAPRHVPSPMSNSSESVADDSDVLPVSNENARSVSVEAGSRGSRASSQTVVVEREDSTVDNVNYEDMKYKELIALARQKGISGTRNLSKADVIDLIRRHDAGGSKQTEGTPLKPFEDDSSVRGDGVQDLTELLSVNQEDSAHSGMAPLDDAEVDGSLVQ